MEDFPFILNNRCKGDRYNPEHHAAFEYDLTAFGENLIGDWMEHVFRIHSLRWADKTIWWMFENGHRQ